MTKPQETRYTRQGDIHLAYQVIGNGPIDLMMLPSFMCHLDLLWEQDPRYRSWVRRVASFSRLILYDTRGAGLSDRDVGDSSLDERVDDLAAILDAVGSTRCALLGFSVGGAVAIRFAARHPQRVSALVLCSTFASIQLPDAATPPDGTDRIRQLVDSAWGEGRTLEIFGPSLWGHPTALARMARLERASLSPRAARTQLAWVGSTDVRADARDLQLPCMVLHRTNDSTVPVEYRRWLGFNIPNAQYVEQHDSDHLIWYGEQSETLDEIQKFLTGSVPDEDIDRFLATVMFTDIVGSTEHLARLGIQVRVGVHTGECQRRGDTVVGISVHTAARIMALAKPDEVLVSRTVTDLVAGSGLRFRDRGTHALKSVPGEWRLFSAG